MGGSITDFRAYMSQYFFPCSIVQSGSHPNQTGEQLEHDLRQHCRVGMKQHAATHMYPCAPSQMHRAKFPVRGPKSIAGVLSSETWPVLQNYTGPFPSPRAIRCHWHEGQKAKARCASLERLLAEAYDLISMVELQHVRTRIHCSYGVGLKNALSVILLQHCHTPPCRRFSLTKLTRDRTSAWPRRYRPHNQED